MAKPSPLTQITAGVAILMGLTWSMHNASARSPQVEPTLRPRVIYGDDDRLDYYQVTSPPLQQLADATVVLIRASLLTDLGATTSIQTKKYGESLGLCPTEPFYDQERAGNCSGFLVSPDTVITAGHCIADQADCDGTRFVFDFKKTSASDQPHLVPTDHVFRCASIVHTVSTPTEEDFAVVKLDRPVTHVQPLRYRSSGQVALGDGLTVIGFPWGLPLKVAAGAQVRALYPSYLQANLDTYAGSSGSAVFNNSSGLVEGVLVRGEIDFELINGCRASKRCSNSGCRGEDVTLFSQVLPYLNP